MKLLRNLLILTSVASATLAGAQMILVTVDGAEVNFPDVQPTMVRGGRVLVPLRGVFEQMGAYVDWNATTRTVVATKGARDVRLTTGEYRAIVDGQPVTLDTPATIMSGRTMVPLRFLSESLNAEVNWLSASRVVQILTVDTEAPPTRPIPPTPPVKKFKTVTVLSETVLPFKLDERLSSEDAMVGDHFVATLDVGGAETYEGLPARTIVRGHVSAAKAKHGDTPGVLGLAFDEIKLPDGTVYPIDGALIGLDSKSVTNDNGRLVAKSTRRNDNLKYVGYGAGAGVLLAVLTRGNALTDGLIGAALGYLFGESQKDPSKVKDVNLAAGWTFGVRLRDDLVVRVRER